MGLYPKIPYQTGRAQAPTYAGRTLDHRAVVRPQLPCTAIVVHGVNDVGVAYGEVEAGLCAGMNERLRLPAGSIAPVAYRAFEDADRVRVEDDPDAIFWKRLPTPEAHSFVVPFYWGFREAQNRERVRGGQFTDRHGNRLDKDLSKGGGPFANATSSLPDLWNRGFGGAFGLIEKESRDPLRPVLDAPGRMYMVLAARRLAALVSMIRDYDPNETVNLVAHSQGCMLSLLAQAFLLEQSLKPADALILTHPPYSLVDELPFLETLGTLFSGGTDAAMEPHYDRLAGLQTLHARLQTLVNLVGAVAEQRRTEPAFEALKAPERCMVGARWSPAEDRDNRGKVYLYFCPEDATVALNAMQGIGWQGVPDHATGSRWHERGPASVLQTMSAKPLDELGKGFFQRVFTRRRRAASAGDAATEVRVGAAPADFVLRTAGEDDLGAVDPDLRAHRASMPVARDAAGRERLAGQPAEVSARRGIRRITGEALARPVVPDLDAGATAGSHGTKEQVDGIDAAVAPTSDYGPGEVWRLVDDPARTGGVVEGPAAVAASPRPVLHPGPVRLLGEGTSRVRDAINAGETSAGRQRDVRQVFACLEADGLRFRRTGRLLVRCSETPDETRRRFQQQVLASRSFHSAIFGSRFNHQHVTAYDLAIGQGEAVSDPLFKAYLVAVADWRMTSDDKNKRPVLHLDQFLAAHRFFHDQELPWRKRLIEENCKYYTSGVLPSTLPLVANLPPGVVCEAGGRSTKPEVRPERIRVESVQAAARNPVDDQKEA